MVGMGQEGAEEVRKNPGEQKQGKRGLPEFFDRYPAITSGSRGGTQAMPEPRQAQHGCGGASPHQEG